MLRLKAFSFVRIDQVADPYAKHFSLIKVSDLVLVDEEGEIQEATPHTANRAGFVIHSCLHQMRPDVNAAVHMHSPHGRAWSAFGRPVEMLVQGTYSTTILPCLGTSGTADC